MSCFQYLRYATSKITAFGRSGRIELARHLFDEMPQRDVVTWNAMISGYSQLGLVQEALALFSHMRISGMKPDEFSFTAVLSAAADACEFHHGQRIHGLLVKFGYESWLPVCNSLIDMYGKCLIPCGARRVFKGMEWRNEVSWCSLLYAYVKVEDFDIAGEVFDKMPNRTEVAWNMLMAGYAQCGEVELCVNLFEEMRASCSKPDWRTFSALMNACAEPFCGRMIHSCVIKGGWNSAIEVTNSILSFYAKISCIEDAVMIFDSINAPTQVSWNTIIDAYMKIGDVTKALLHFQQAPEKNIVSWTTMISGYAKNGHGESALGLFIEMMKNLQPDDFTFGAAIHACSNLALLGHGKMVHGCVIHYGFHCYIYVGNSLVNMYAKCGDLEGSYRAFNSIAQKDLISWNAVLFAFGLHGLAIEAFRIYDDMVVSNVRPDKVTFIGLLMACSHSGLIEQGQWLFDSMSSVYGVAPEADHVACMVDMLGRAGHLKEASKLAEKYSRILINTSSCEYLLGYFAVHGNIKVGEKICREMMAEEPQRDIGYVTMSNLYSTSGKWKEAEMVRKAMIERGVKKMPGCSWIEVRTKLMVFVSGSSCSHPYMEEICKLLNYLEFEMRNPSSIGFENYKAFNIFNMELSSMHIITL